VNKKSDFFEGTEKGTEKSDFSKKSDFFEGTEKGTEKSDF
jgi:hypothetical protein